MTRPASRPRLALLARHLHQLGERATFELILEEIAAHGPDVIERLERYRRLDPETLRALGVDRLPPRPLRRVA